MGYSKWSRERSEPIKESAAKEVAKMRRSKPRSGDPLEYWAAHYFGKELGFRVPESGRLGHKEVLFDPQLQGDFVNDLPWLPRRIRGDGSQDVVAVRHARAQHHSTTDCARGASTTSGHDSVGVIMDEIER